MAILLQFPKTSVPQSFILDIYGRLFNHRPFVQGEVRHFVREIETKKGDREVNDTFEILQVGTAHSVSFTKIWHFVNKIAY